MIAKYIVLSSIFSVVSDNILCICIQEPLLISKKFIVLHILSAYNSLLVHYKVYLSDHRECFCTSWRYAEEAYENFNIDPAPCRKNPIKKQNCHTKLSVCTTRRKLHWNKSVTAKVCLVWYLILRKIALK